MRREQRFEKDVSSLEEVFEFLGRFLEEEDLGTDLAFCLDFVVEEIFTNMVRHNKSSRNEILLEADRRDDQIVIRLVDFDVEPFDPDTAPDVDVDAPLSERTPGGLGLHLVKSMVDKLSYEYRDRELDVTIYKNLTDDVRDRARG